MIVDILFCRTFLLKSMSIPGNGYSEHIHYVLYGNLVHHIAAIKKAKLFPYDLFKLTVYRPSTGLIYICDTLTYRESRILMSLIIHMVTGTLLCSTLALLDQDSSLCLLIRTTPVAGGFWAIILTHPMWARCWA